MLNNNVYLEKQKFDQKWLKIILYSVLTFTFFLSIFVYNKEMHNVVAFIPFFLVVLLVILFKKGELVLTIDAEIISYRFIPFHAKPKIINKKDILRISLDSYNPIGDYDGWGIRFGRKGRAYTISGNFGIQLKIRGDKNILIGTRQPSEVYKVLREKGYNPGSNVY